MPRGLNTLHQLFKDIHLIHFGGMVLLQDFAINSHFIDCLNDPIRVLPQDYHYREQFEIGLKRIDIL